MIVTNSTQLGELLNLVHDRWFNIERVALDRDRRIVEIHLEARKADLEKGSKSKIVLRIKDADVLTVKDTEKVRDYDLNEIKFAAASGLLTITGGIPITIEVKVSALNIEAIESKL